MRDYPSTPKSAPRFGATLGVDGGVIGGGGVIGKEKGGQKDADDESFDNESGIGRSRAGLGEIER